MNWPKVNWWRGFVRIWAAFSVIWVAGVILLERDEIFVSSSQTSQSGYFLRDDGSRTGPEKIREAVKRAEAAGDSDGAKRLKDLADKVQSNVDAAISAHAANLRRVSVTALAPPILFLMLLFGCRWIVRGFKPP